MRSTDPNPCSLTTSSGARKVTRRALASGALALLALGAALVAPVVVAALDASTSTTVSSLNPSGVRSAVTFTVRVAVPAGSLAPTGTVAVSDGTTPLGTCTLASAACTVSSSSLAVGSHAIVATYNGDATHVASTSPVLIQRVVETYRSASAAGSSGSVTALTIAGPTSATSGDLLVAAITATGGSGVTINPGSGWQRIGTDLNSGTVLKQGVFWRSVTSGDTSLASTWTLSGSQRASGVVMLVAGGAAGAPVAGGQANASSTTVATPALALGTTRTGVAILFGGSAVGTTVSSVGAGYTRATSISASGGKATTQTTTVGAYGSLTRVATVAASSIVLGAAAVNIGHTVFVPQMRALSVAQLSSSLATVTFGQTPTLTVRVDASSATGDVAFSDGTAFLGRCTLASGTCQLPAPGLSAGSHALTARYAGDADLFPSTSAPLAQLVNPAGSSTRLSSGANPAVHGSSIALTATVATSDGSVAIGSVTVVEGLVTVGSCSLSSGSCVVNATGLSVGSHSLSAVYGGDANHSGSSSALLVQRIDPAPTTISVSSSPNPSSFGQLVTFTVSVSSGDGVPTGTVSLADGGVAVSTCLLSSGSCTIPVSNLTIGTHSITAAYGGDATRAGSTLLTPYAQVVGRVGSATTLTTAPNPSVRGGSVALTASVAASDGTVPTGSVSFSDGTTGIGSCTLSSGSCTWSTTALAVGSRSLTAVYGGDATRSGSTSPSVVQVVNRAPSTTTLVASPSPSTTLQIVTFTATVTSGDGIPTGTVTILDGSASLGTCTLAALTGTCSLPVGGLTVGAHQIVARYGGDTSRAPSDSPLLVQSVTSVASTLTIASSAASAPFGATVSLTATVSPSTASGTVTFTEGTTALGSCVLSSGRCSIPVSTFTVGTHTVGARYGGDATYDASSATFTQTTTKGSTTTTVTSDVSTATFGTAIRIAATVAPATATGTISFSDGTTGIGTCALAGGSCSTTVSSLTVGSHSIVARYAGDATYNGSPSGSITVTITKGSSTTTLASSPNPSGFGRTVRFTATVTPVAPSGVVAFIDGTTSIGSCPVVAGSCSFSTNALSLGTHQIVATFSGDANLTGSSSTVLSQVVTIGSDVTLTSAPNPATYGSPVAYTATVVTADGIAASGTVTVLDGTTSLGVCALPAVDPNSCTVTATASTTGDRSIVARYDGDALHAPNTSPAIVQTILKASATPAIASAANPSTFGSSVGITISVSTGDGGPASGVVSLSEGTLRLGTCTLAGSGCTVTLSGLSTGTHLLVASYAGDANHTAGVSSTFTQTVSQAPTTTTLATSASSVAFGSPVTFTATVAPSVATGTVTFLDGGTTLGTCSLGSGTCPFTTSALAGGAHSITARYGGDTNYATSTSAALAQTVTRVASLVTLTGPASSTYGSSVSLAVTVSPAGATGSVSFSDGTAGIGTCTLGTPTAGTCLLSIATLAAGPHAITARYAGNTSLEPGVSATLALTVAQIATTTTIAASADPILVGSGSVTVTVGPAGPTGTVVVSDAGTPVGSCPLVSGTCTVALGSLALGSHTLTASYGGSPNHLPSDSSPLTLGVVMGFRGASAAGTGTSTQSSLAVAAPSGALAGDVLVAAVTIASSTVAIPTPAGWTRLAADLSSATTTLRQAIFWRSVTSGDATAATTWTFSTKVKGTAVIIAVGGASRTAPSADAFAGRESSASTTIATPALALSSTRTGIALLFAGTAAGTTQTSVGTGFTIPASGGSATTTGGGVLTTSGSAYGSVVTTSTIGASSITFGAAAVGIGHAIFLDQLP